MDRAAFADGIKAFQDDIDAMLNRVRALESKVEEYRRERDTMQGQLDGKEAEIKALVSRLEALEQGIAKVKADSFQESMGYMLLLNDAAEILGDAFDKSAFLRAPNPRAVKVEVIKKLDPNFTDEGLSDEYINGRYEQALQTLRRMKSEEGLAALKCAAGQKSDAATGTAGSNLSDFQKVFVGSMTRSEKKAS